MNTIDLALEVDRRGLNGQNNRTGLLPFLPMLYVGWADAVLTPGQIEVIYRKIDEQEWLQQAEKQQLHNWLDPTTPPSVGQMKEWLALIHQAAGHTPETSRQTLATLGMEVARIGARDENERCVSPEVCAALDAVEDALGIVSQEAYRGVVEGEGRPQEVFSTVPETSFDVAAMTTLLDGEQADIRWKMRHLLTDPVFAYEPITDRDLYRDKVLFWSQLLAKQSMGNVGYPEAYGGEGDVAKYLAAMETLSHHDLSLLVKFGVQFGLFGGSIHLLGTEQHHQKYLRDVGTLELPGCFAMTELGHGSNVRDIETVARYDRATQEFVIHTPSENARKEYIGNAARHGQLATVFAQLEIDDQNYGVNAFLVPIRNRDGEIQPGVRIEDNGEKLGLNGVDNGRIWFDHVRIPRQSMLNRFSEVTPEGEYISPIAGESRRFFTMIGTLVAGRLGITAASLSAAKSSLTIATRYAARRRQFGPVSQPETLLLDYQTHQRRLMPLLANAYALDFGLKYLVRRYVERTEEDAREIETLAAGLKAYSSWNTTHTVQTCREACGGQGYMAVNRFVALKADTDIFTTFEGDNTVLMQLVAKGCLSDFKQQFHDMKLMGLVRYIAQQAAQNIVPQNPITARSTDEQHLRDSDFHLSAFRYREQRMLGAVARRLKKRIERGMDSHTAMIECQDHLVNLGHAFIERIVLEQFVAGIEQNDDPSLDTILKKLCDLYALSHMEIHKGWYLEHGYMEGAKTKAIRRQVDKLCYEVSREAVALVDAFAIPDQCIAAPIGL